MPSSAIPIEENASAVKQIVDVISNARRSDPNFRPGTMFDMLQNKYPAFAKYVQRQGQSSGMQKPGKNQMALTHGGQRHMVNKPKPATQKVPAKGSVQSGDYTPPESAVSDTRGSGVGPTQKVQDKKPTSPGGYAPPENYPGTNSSPTAKPPQGGGVLNKIWSFAKNNKGIMTGAVALGLLGALTMVPGAQPIATSGLLTALKTAGIGGGIGAFKTKGSIKDKIMGGLNAAGYASAIGGAIGGVGAGGTGEGIETAPPTIEPVGLDGGMDSLGNSTADITDADVEGKYADAMLDGEDGALADGSISDAEATDINSGLDGNQPVSPNDVTANTDSDTVDNTSKYDVEADMEKAHDELDTDGNGRLDDNEMKDLKTFGNAMDGPSDATGDSQSQEPGRDGDDDTVSTPEDEITKKKMRYAHSQMDTNGDGVISDLESGPNTNAFMKKYAELMGQWPGKS
jgi:hypothetical protein